MAARKKAVKQTTREILAGVTITIVARKKGQPEKQKDMVYEEALKAKKIFEAKGWAVSLYQQGFYQPFGKNKT
ncbi:hypothetical protein B620_gp58 [Croceibacter phage P2559S]|uniref:hypothetical protein n=1 Tax=Croceibacter phage P2559S TaxID=1176422 RepID=UPI0002688ED5|nr:hypothetical protein B620_gp58 [Croceibacter phage P2559S]AFM54836.1 hypothetical protein P2559S_58 [Croceibacter phage P2559S]